MRWTLAWLTMCFSSAAFAQNEVDQREANQQQRIEQGEKSGELTNREANHVERQQAHIDNQVARERAANGGHLTKAEHAQVNREQDRASRNIYRKKHNDRVK
jgi:hypothetical protein